MRDDILDDPYFGQPSKPFSGNALAVMGALFALLFLFGCKENCPPTLPEGQIRGAWERDWGGSGAVTRYQFDGNGQCLTFVSIPAQPVEFYAYAYSFSGDTLKMTDLASGDTAHFLAEFPTDTTADLNKVGGLKYFLKRI